MIKIRSLKEALIYIKSLDSDTVISGNAIRMYAHTVSERKASAVEAIGMMYGGMM